MNQIYLNYSINKILFIIVTFIIFCCLSEETTTSLTSKDIPTTSPITACSACLQPPPAILQPKDSGAKCINAPILESFTVAAQVDTNTCKYYVECNKTASIVAHLADNDKSSCLPGLLYMYFLCINSTWMAEFRGHYYPSVDQLYCYESDENSCSKCPELPLKPLQPGNKTKCDDNDQATITPSTLKNVTGDSSVCMWQVLCSGSSSGTVVNLNDTVSESCIYFWRNWNDIYKCFNGKWTVSACDYGSCKLFSYHEFDEIHCYGPKPATTALTTKGPTKLSTLQSTIHSSTSSTRRILASQTSPLLQTSTKPITTGLEVKTENNKLIIYAIVIPSVIALLVVISTIIASVCMYYRGKRQAPEVLRSEAQENHYVQTMR